MIAPARFEDQKDLPDFVLELNVPEEQKRIDQHGGHLAGNPRGVDQLGNFARENGRDGAALEVGDQRKKRVFILKRILGHRFVCGDGIDQHPPGAERADPVDDKPDVLV